MPHPSSRGALRWSAPAVALFLAMATGSCAPADDPEALLGAVSGADIEARVEASERIDQLIGAGDYKVFVRGLSSPNLLIRAQSMGFLAQVKGDEPRKVLRSLLSVERRMMLPYNPVRLRPSSDPSDSRILAATLIQRNGGDPEAIGVLLAGAEEQQTADTLAGTCFAVGALQDEKGLAFLDKAVRHPEMQVVRAAVQALGQFRGEEAVALLARTLDHPAIEVRSDILSSIDTRDDAASLAMLRRVGAEDPSADLRASAYQLLSQRADPDLVPYLIERLKDAPPEARSAAVGVLSRVTGQSLGSRPEPWERWWAKNRPVATTAS